VIIQSARLRVGLDVAALRRHVFAGSANATITVLHGDADDLAAMHRDAASAGKRYAIRHIKLSPAAPVSLADMAQVMSDLAREFGFELGRRVVVEHLKPRATEGGYERHWHLLVPEYDPVRRGVLDAHWLRPRQEKIARLAELRLGHTVVSGRWNAAVARALSAEGQADAALTVAPLGAVPRPGSAYTARRHQTAARFGMDLPKAKATVAAAWANAEDAPAFIMVLAAAGMSVRPGETAGVWPVDAQRLSGAAPILIGALHQLVREPRH
jgi:hypothetical protein